MTGCGDWLNSTPAESKVELFGLSLWSQRKTDPKSEKNPLSIDTCEREQRRTVGSCTISAQTIG